MSAHELAAAMVRVHYRRQLHWKKWRVVWWHPENPFPIPVGNSVADRRAMLRTATGLKRPPYCDALWEEIVRLLPEVPTHAEFEAIAVRNPCAGTQDWHALFDVVDPTGGAA